MTSLDLINNYKLQLVASVTVSALLIKLKQFFGGGYFNDNVTRMDGKTVIITGSNTGEDK